jgi:hypothetical protein
MTHGVVDAVDLSEECADSPLAQSLAALVEHGESEQALEAVQRGLKTDESIDSLIPLIYQLAMMPRHDVVGQAVAAMRCVLQLVGGLWG